MSLKPEQLPEVAQLVIAEVSMWREGWGHHWRQGEESETWFILSAEGPHLIHKPQIHTWGGMSAD